MAAFQSGDSHRHSKFQLGSTLDNKNGADEEEQWGECKMSEEKEKTKYGTYFIVDSRSIVWEDDKFKLNKKTPIQDDVISRSRTNYKLSNNVVQDCNGIRADNSRNLICFVYNGVSVFILICFVYNLFYPVAPSAQIDLQ